MPEDKIVPITMGVDIQWVKRKNNKIFEIEKIKSDYYLIAYIGTLSFLRNPRFVLETMALVAKRGIRCKLLMIGKADNRTEESELRKICTQLFIENDVIFTGYINRNRMQDYLLYCDLTLSRFHPPSILLIVHQQRCMRVLAMGYQ